MSGKRYRQRRRYMRTWGGHPDAAGMWYAHGAHQSLRPDWSLTIGAMFSQHAREALDSALYSTPMGYADPLNRDRAVERHLLYGGANLQQPGPAFRGITGS